MAIATLAATFVGALGINTHIDFATYGYQNLTTVESDISYLGVKIIRDSAEVATDAQSWQQVVQATGAKFDDYIAETSPADMQTDLGFVRQLDQEGILASVEGGNEEDDAYPVSLGNTLLITAQFQQQVYALGKQLHLPVINMSFGAGWTAANDWQGDYGVAGDLSAYTDYANAHSYPNPGQLPDDTIQRMNGLAILAASTRPVITTEIGWDATEFNQQTITKYVLDAAMDGAKDGDAGLYFYGLYDDASGNWGLFNADGTARPSATALHNLTTLLVDAGLRGSSFTPGSLDYTLGGTKAGDSSVLIEKSNGQFWLSLWNETEAANTPHTITVNLGSQAATVTEYDPLTGTNSIASWSNVSTLQVPVPDHPVLLEIVPGAGGVAVPAPTPAPPNGPTFTVPGGEATTTGSAIALSGVSVIDGFAASNPGTMTLTVSASTGLITMTAGGSKLAGSGTRAISVSGTLAQINAELATLSYTAASSAGNDVITVDVWDQAGLDGTKSFDVAVKASAATPPPPSMPAMNIAATDSDPVITVNRTTINAASGDHVFFIGGTDDTLTAVGGTETVMAFQGSNTITTGAGNDTIRIAGSGSVISAGAGANEIDDSGNDNRIVLPQGGQGSDDIYGYVLQDGDMLDLRPLLAATKWNGNARLIGNFIKVAAPNLIDAVLTVDPSGIVGAASYGVATLHGSGPVSLSELLSDSLT